MTHPITSPAEGRGDGVPPSSDRRRFLQWSAAATAVLAIGCGNETTAPGAPLAASGKGPVTPGAGSVSIDLANDLGILNFAYALEQLEAAFYTLVVADFYNGGSSEERAVLEDLKKHEVIHREFFKAVLGGAAIPALSFDFSSINFKARGRVLQIASDFEELGVSAYNGAAQYISNTDYLVIAGKIVSVEARHASAVASLLRPNGKSFAPRAFDLARSPSEVLSIASRYIATQVTLVNAPAA